MSGVILGGGIGTLISAQYTKNKYSKIADQQIKEMEIYYQKMDEYQRVPHGDEEESEGGDASSNLPHIMTKEERDAEKKRIRNPQKRDAFDYRKCYTSHANTTESEHPTEEDLIKEKEIEAFEFHEENRGRECEILSEESVEDLPTSVPREILYYYTPDDQFSDEERVPISNPEYLIGEVATDEYFELFLNNRIKEELVYVMNYELNTCYEIYRCNYSINPDDSLL